MADRSPAGGGDATAGAEATPAAPRPASRAATWSLWLGAAGVGFGFLLMFAVLTPAAILYGVRGLREIRSSPDLAGRARAWMGIGLAVAAPVLWVGLFVGLLADGLI